MPTYNIDVKRIHKSTKVALAAALIVQQWGFAEDENRVIVKDSSGTTHDLWARLNDNIRLGGNYINNDGDDDGLSFNDDGNAVLRSTTGSQLELEFDGSNQATLAVDSGGILTVAPGGAEVHVTGGLTVTTIEHDALDHDKFLVSDSGVVKYRTGAEISVSLVAGSDTEIQYNNSGAFGASSHFKYDGESIVQTKDLSASSFAVSKSYAFGDNETDYLRREYYVAEGTEASPENVEENDEFVLCEDFFKVLMGGSYQTIGKYRVETEAQSCYLAPVYKWYSDAVSSGGSVDSIASILESRFGLLTVGGGYFADKIGLSFQDHHSTDDSVVALIETVSTDTGSGTEDADVWLKQMVAGSMTTFLESNADGDITLGDGVRAIDLDGNILNSIDQTKDISGSAYEISKSYAFGTGESDYIEREYRAAEGTEASPAVFNDADAGTVIYADRWSAYYDSPPEWVNFAKNEVIIEAASGPYVAPHFLWSARSSDSGESFTELLKLSLADGAVLGVNETIKTSTPALSMYDTDCGSGDKSFGIDVNAVVVTPGSEDVSVTISRQLDGFFEPFLVADEDGVITIGGNQDNSIVLDEDVTVSSGKTLAAEQLRIYYDAANYADLTVDSSGKLTIAPSGSEVLLGLSDIVFSGGHIKADTDTRALTISGGSSGSATNGSWILLSGVDNAFDGDLRFYAGNNSDSGKIEFITNGTSRGRFNYSGELQVETVIMLKERAAATTDISGYGQIWAKTDNTLWFTDDGGTDHQIAFV